MENRSIVQTGPAALYEGKVFPQSTVHYFRYLAQSWQAVAQSNPSLTAHQVREG